MAKTSGDFKMTTVEKIGVIRDTGKNTLELRKTDVNGTVKYDIREWYTDNDGNEKCNKGIRLTEEEILKLGEIINDIGGFDD